VRSYRERTVSRRKLWQCISLRLQRYLFLLKSYFFVLRCVVLISFFHFFIVKDAFCHLLIKLLWFGIENVGETLFIVPPKFVTTNRASTTTRWRWIMMTVVLLRVICHIIPGGPIKRYPGFNFAISSVNVHRWRWGVEFDTYRNVQRHRAVLHAIAQLSCYVCFTFLWALLYWWVNLC